jgi:hypothetical protein
VFEVRLKPDTTFWVIVRLKPDITVWAVVVSASYEAGPCQGPCRLHPFAHTIAEAAEQALPNREGPRRRPGIPSRCCTVLRELVASWS